MPDRLKILDLHSDIPPHPFYLRIEDFELSKAEPRMTWMGRCGANRVIKIPQHDRLRKQASLPLIRQESRDFLATADYKHGSLTATAQLIRSKYKIS